MERVGEAFTWPFRDPQWVEKVVVMGLIMLIPIVGGIVGLGWMLASVDRLRAGDERLPPANFDHLGRGFQLFVVYLVYGLVMVFIAGLFFVPAFVLLSLEGGGNDHPALAFIGIPLLLLAFSVAVIEALGFNFITPGVVLAVDRGGIEGGLRLGDVLHGARKSPINTLIAGLMLIAAGFISQLGGYACIVGIIFTVPYAIAMQAWIIRSYELSLSTALKTS